jgi:hypothetical protein
MDDLFRFLLLRPATPVAPNDINRLSASFAPADSSRDVARRQARTFINGNTYAKLVVTLTFSGVALQVVARLRGTTAPAADIKTIVQHVTGRTIDAVVADPAFASEQKLLADTLVAMKLLSDAFGGDAAGLAIVARGYDAIELAAHGRDPVGLRPLSLPDYAPGGPLPPSPNPSGPPLPPTTESSDPKAAAAALVAANAALAALSGLPALAFEISGSVGPAPTGAPAGGPRSAWMLSSSAIGALPEAVRKALGDNGVDLATQPLPVALETLHAARARLNALAAEITGLVRMTPIGNTITTVAPGDYVGDPTGVMPSKPGNLRPAGIGDLLMVKQHTLRYEGGELAHVENVLKSEHLSRDTRRLERTETTVLQETETTKEETRDTQTTERFSLNRETSNTIKEDSSLKAGLSVDAKYGPFVEVKANADYSTSVSTESAEKQAAEFSKEVVDRSTTKLVERVLERRTVTTIVEFEEKYSHGFDNTSGTHHITGYYQWIDKVLQAQVYNYGKRLLFDVTVPEPATNFILAQTQSGDPGRELVKPAEFTALASEIDEVSYLTWAKQYDATGLEPSPPPTRTVVKAFAGVLSAPDYESTGSETLAIDDGYRAKYCSFVKDAVQQAGAQFRVFVGSTFYDALTADQHRDLAGETGSIGFAYDTHLIHVHSASIEIFCERTERAYQAWQLKTHAAITQAYLAKVQDYEQKLAQARAAAGTVIAGRNPEFNQRLVTNELRLQCLSLLTGQHFDAFGALEMSSEGYAEPNLDRTAVQMPYIRFFEQAFEWEHLVYFFYPYFWGWKTAWKRRLLLDDVDPAFGDFLRAGAARVVFPVRPGFEAAVIHYLESGEIWNGGPAPDITGSLYVPIVTEIQESTGAPGNEAPVGDPWLVRLPTTLVRIRPNDDLPAWQKHGEDWVPVN